MSVAGSVKLTRSTPVVDARRRAVQFFWSWLILATAMSVAGNVTHAILKAPTAMVWLAAVAALVPPVVLLGSTHTAALLIRAHPRMGSVYAASLVMTVGVAACAFVLSFDALRDLAQMLGMRADRAWLFPIAIDLSIANSTLALLSLAPRHLMHADGTPSRPASPPEVPRRRTTSGHVAAPDRSTAPAPAAVYTVARSPTVAADPETDSTTEDETGGLTLDSAAVVRWTPTAQQLVRSGVTSKDPTTVAAILAEHAAGTPPSTISRRRGVHHTTVGRILAGAAELAG